MPDLTKIQELAVLRRDARGREFTAYIYFAWIDGRWIDLAPFGNRMPS